MAQETQRQRNAMEREIHESLERVLRIARSKVWLDSRFPASGKSFLSRRVPWFLRALVIALIPVPLFAVPMGFINHSVLAGLEAGLGLGGLVFVVRYFLSRTSDPELAEPSSVADLLVTLVAGALLGLLPLVAMYLVWSSRGYGL